MTYAPAFPAELEPIAGTLLPALAIGEQWPASQGFTVNVQSQVLSMPGRVYYEPKNLRQLIESSNEEAKVLALCLGTRHWDGFVREECLRKVIQIDQSLVAPFVIQLVGEYVIEIVSVVVSALQDLNRSAYSNFVLQNPEFMATTRRRVTSYWNCYHRSSFPRLQDYPGFVAFREIEGLREAAL